jgi:hypothetical protein
MVSGTVMKLDFWPKMRSCSIQKFTPTETGNFYVKITVGNFYVKYRKVKRLQRHEVNFNGTYSLQKLLQKFFQYMKMNCCQYNEFPSSFNALFNLHIASEEANHIREETNPKYFLNCCCENVDHAHPTIKVMCQRQWKSIMNYSIPCSNA